MRDIDEVTKAVGVYVDYIAKALDCILIIGGD